MHENDYLSEKAILVSVDIGEFDSQASLSELEELAETAGVEVVSVTVQKRAAYNTATCIGMGKLDEISDFSKNNDINLLIFDHELTGTQIKNIEKSTGVRVIDRTTLILDIFAKRALTSEGRIQVELAQQKYRLPRLTGMGVELSKLGGGIGTRGPGESKLENDKRHIRKRIAFLENEIKTLEKRRSLIRQRRKKNDFLSIAIVGYTNAGKSTLLNTLTDSNVLTENKLFATLDPSTRGLILPDGRNVLVTDTVGFIRRLPHQLVQAFKSTLEETSNADLILLVCDISSNEMDEQIQCCETLLSELGCGNLPIIKVYNKCDIFPGTNFLNKDDSIFISAATGMGLDILKNTISKVLPLKSRRMKLLIPYKNTGFISKIRDDGKIYNEKYMSDGICVDALIDVKLIKEAKIYENSAPVYSEYDLAQDLMEENFETY